MKTLATRQRRQAGQAALMKAALLLFSRKGFEETKVEDICMAAGYSKGGFYFHFKDKNELLLGILDDTPDLADWRQPGALVIELWAQASRNEALRARLYRHYEACRVNMLRSALVAGKDQTKVTGLLNLLLLLGAGLAVQGRLYAPDSEAEALVDSLIGALSSPSAVSRQQGQKAASATHYFDSLIWGAPSGWKVSGVR